MELLGKEYIYIANEKFYEINFEIPWECVRMYVNLCTEKRAKRGWKYFKILSAIK